LEFEHSHMISKSNRLNAFGEYYFSKKLREVAQLKAEGLDVINLGIGSPDLPAPQVAIDALNEAAKQSGAHQYQSYRGLPELREAIAKWYQYHFNVSLNPTNEILPLIGSKEGIFHLSMAFLDTGDTVLVPDPGYPAYTNCAKLAGANIVSYNLKAENNWLPNLDEIEKNLNPKTKMMWVNYPHMPTGAAASREFFQQLIHFAQKNNILICHDNPYTFILNENPISILDFEGAKDVAVELNSLSKSYNMAGWRVGMLAGAAPYIEATQQVSSNLGSGMFKALQVAAAEVLALDDTWFEDLNEVYKKRKIVGTKILTVLACPPEAGQVGMFLWAKAPDEIKDIEIWLDELLHATGVFLTPGFIFGQNGAQYVRLSLCNTVEVLEKALNRIEGWRAKI